MKDRLSASATVTLALGIVGVLCSPYVFTRPGLVSFTSTGEIGDTIGGLTAPVIGFVSAILVYLALLSQVEANRIVQEQISNQETANNEQKNFDSLLEIYRQVKDDLDNLAVMRDEGGGSFRQRLTGDATPVYVTYTGVRAIAEVFQETANNYCQALNGGSDFSPPDEFTSINDIAHIFDLLLTKMQDAPLAELDGETLKALVNHLYKSRIESVLPTSCPRCNQLHEVFPETFQLILEKLKGQVSSLAEGGDLSKRK